MSGFVKMMRVVGDLDDPFYDDERQRDVWNEAAAAGFQLFLWAAIVAGAVLPWVAGDAGAWTALGLLLASAAISYLTMAFSRASNVDLYTAPLLRPRSVAVGVLMAVGFVGIAYQLTGDAYAETSTWIGGVVGAVIGGGAAAWGIARHRRRAALFEAEEND